MDGGWPLPACPAHSVLPTRPAGSKHGFLGTGQRAQDTGGHGLIDTRHSPAPRLTQFGLPSSRIRPASGTRKYGPSQAAKEPRGVERTPPVRKETGERRSRADREW